MWLKEKPPNLRIYRSSSRLRSNSGRIPPEEPAVEHSSRKRDPSHERDPRKNRMKNPIDQARKELKRKPSLQVKTGQKPIEKAGRTATWPTPTPGSPPTEVRIHLKKAKVGSALVQNRRTCLRRRHHHRLRRRQQLQQNGSKTDRKAGSPPTEVRIHLKKPR